MQVCFINPPLQDFYTTTIRRQPLGLLYIMAAVQAAGHQVSLINGHSPKSKLLPIPLEFDYLTEFIGHPDPAYRFPFKHYHHFGLSWEEIVRQLKTSAAEIYFVSALFTTYHQETAQVIKLLRQFKPAAKIVVGGYHAALYPDYFLKELQVDYVLTGEGEASAVNLLAAIGGQRSLTEVNSLAYLHNEEVTKTAPGFVRELDTLAYPAREFLRPRDFNFYRQKGVSLITSRGCPNYCSFCSSRDFWGNTYRLRSAAAVIAEIEFCQKTYGAQFFNFEDDNLFINVQFARELLTGLIRYQTLAKTKLDLTAMNGISLETMNEELIALLARAGFKEINLSLVTHSTQLQAKLGRPFDTQQFANIVSAAQNHNLNIRSYFILGLPEQTKEEIEETIQFLQKLNVSIFPSIYYNVNSLPKEWKLQRSSGFRNETKHLKRSDLIYYFNRAISQRT